MSVPRHARGVAGAQFVALLRGINVGGTNLMPMPALRASFTAAGFLEVATYIQSGNVLFRAAESDPRKIATRIARALSSDFGYGGQVVLRSHAQMEAIIRHAPAGFGAKPLLYRYDVVFLQAPLGADEAMTAVATRQGVDEAHAGDGVIYFSRLISLAAQSYLPRLASKPVYKQMTVRNWNTTTRLLALMGT